MIVKIPGSDRGWRAQVALLACQFLVQIGEQLIEAIDVAKFEISAQALLKRFDIRMQITAAMTPKDALLEGEIASVPQ
jgi:hypothetical protein